MRHTVKKLLSPLLLTFLLLTGGLSACGGSKVELKMAPASELPPTLQQAPINVREAYQFALANKDILEKIPCYCGCGGMGHQSNYMCYVQDDSSADGQIVFDSHAYG
ncbi:MAG: hypothetical protein GXP39_01460 [Chloroflexi bacterium]|nr:hypothetical protein [Chloroflexota bacterium]